MRESLEGDLVGCLSLNIPPQSSEEEEEEEGKSALAKNAKKRV